MSCHRENEVERGAVTVEFDLTPLWIGRLSSPLPPLSPSLKHRHHMYYTEEPRLSTRTEWPTLAHFWRAALSAIYISSFSSPPPPSSSRPPAPLHGATASGCNFSDEILENARKRGETEIETRREPCRRCRKSRNRFMRTAIKLTAPVLFLYRRLYRHVSD